MKNASTVKAGHQRPVGLVLAGGGSRRMGRDKALIQVDGQSLVATAARKLQAACSEVLVADQGRGYLPDVPSVSDGPGRGPMAGLLGAARARPGRTVLALACDLPGVPAPLLDWLGRQDLFDWVVPRRAGRFEPLCALYGPAALEALAERAEAGRYDLQSLGRVAGLAVQVVSERDLEPFGDPDQILRNLNRPEDLPSSTE